MRALSQDEHRRIDDAAAAIERRTHAHFALAIVPISDRYLLYPVLWAALTTFTAAGIAALIRPDLPFSIAFIGEAILFVASALLFDWLPVRLALVPRRIKHTHARRLAHQEFAARILVRSDHAAGLLLFVSRGERYVELIATREIHARVGEEEWNRIVAAFVAAVKADRVADGFVAAIEACGAHLERHFPRDPSASASD
jgi:putative membrane protein